MHPSPEKQQCDVQRLRCYLDQKLTATEEAALESHLDECRACRQQISDWAAEPPWWTSAGKYLKPDAFDEELSAMDSGVHVGSTIHPHRTPNEIILRQIQEWLDPTDDPKFIGRFGGYEILGVIGHGGMGVVLKGFEPSLNRYVAIKLLAPPLATNGAARKRFAREAQAAAAVLHENVIAIHRVAEAHDLPYLVMPYVHGVTLQKRIDGEGPLPLVAILRISRQIAAGLAAAHAQGLVHRDIKPANILLERGVERVTLTDFGLARAADDGSVTRTGVIAGTPQYMSPEQARGESIDARSDLFSLGSVIYAMCTGHPPFRAETGYGILRRITDIEPRPIRQINPEIPDWFENIVWKLHAKSPAERFRSAEELSELIEECLEHVNQPAGVPLPATIRRLSPASGKARSPLGLHTREWGVALVVLAVSASIGLLGLSFGWLAWPKPARRAAESIAGPSEAEPDSQPSLGDEPSPLPWEDGIQQRLRDLGKQLERLKEPDLGIDGQDAPGDPANLDELKEIDGT